jgi:hypothetical protein
VSSAYRLRSTSLATISGKGLEHLPIHFSDGDNYYSDNDEAVKLADDLIATCNFWLRRDRRETSSYRRSSGALLSIFKDRLRSQTGSSACASMTRRRISCVEGILRQARRRNLIIFYLDFLFSIFFGHK